LLLRFAGVYTVAPIEATFGSVACALGGLARRRAPRRGREPPRGCCRPRPPDAGATPGWPAPSSSSRRRSSGAARRWIDPDRRVGAVRRHPRGL